MKTRDSGSSNAQIGVHPRFYLYPVTNNRCFTLSLANAVIDDSIVALHFVNRAHSSNDDAIRDTGLAGLIAFGSRFPSVFWHR